MRWAGAAVDPTDPALPEGVEPLSQHVTGAGRAGAPARADRRGRARRRPRASLPLLKPGQRLVSREGDLWRWDGFAVAANAPTGAARRLAERNRLAEIEAELKPRAPMPKPSAQRRGAGRSAKRPRPTRPNRGAHALARSAARGAEAARERHAAAERELSRDRRARVGAGRSARPGSPPAATEARGRARRGASARWRTCSRPAETGAQLGDVRGEITASRGRVAEVRAEAQALAREAELAERRLRAIATEQQAWTSARRRRARRSRRSERAAEETTTERDEPGDAPAAFAEKRSALIGEIEMAEAARRDGGRPAGRRRDRARRCRPRRARRARGASAPRARSARRAEERFEGAKRTRSPMSRTKSARCWRSSRHEVASLAEHQARRRALPDVADVEARARTSCGASASGSAPSTCAPKRNCARSRPSTRTLTTERDDLVEAIKRLRQGIQSLNREARERLLASFEVVNGHFKRLFTELFGGGTAELQLIESDDPLEAGLDILAKPPGKKPQTLSLLSGGEQALTALALIFAVFLTNPAPICVLDEVDAPLDDHNVERFCDLLDEMTRSTETRFVIITHNPITMARMNRLFGVTMAERGVSQLVSVDLEAAVKFREAV